MTSIFQDQNRTLMDRHTSLYLTRIAKDAADSEKRLLGSKQDDCSAPVWSPNSKLLAFYCTDSKKVTSLWIWDVRTAQEHPIHDMSISHTNPFGASVRWLPDNRRLITQIPFPGAANRPPEDASVPQQQSSGPTVFRFVPGERAPLSRAFAPRNHSDFALVDTMTGSFSRLRPDATPSAYALSADGSTLAYLVQTGVVDGDINGRTTFDLYVLRLSSGRSRRVQQNLLGNWSGNTFSLSPNGAIVAFLGGPLIPQTSHVNDTLRDLGTAGYCYFIDTTTGRIHRSHVLIDKFQKPPVWNSAGTELFTLGAYRRSLLGLSPFTGTLEMKTSALDMRFKDTPDALQLSQGVIVARAQNEESAEEAIYAISSSGKITKIVGGLQDYREIHTSANGSISYITQSATVPADIWVIAKPYQHALQVTDVNPSWHTRNFGQLVRVSWKSALGLLSGDLLLPPDYLAGRRYPLVVIPYGGEKAGTVTATLFGLNQEDGLYPMFDTLLFSTRGYVVFVPDTIARVGHPMNDIADGVISGTKHVIAMGIADPQRLAIWGQSYGGYSVGAVIVNTAMFKAAIATAGDFNMVTSYGVLNDDGSSDNVYWAEQFQGRMGGSPWMYQNRYIENSPFFKLNKVATPLLLEYGSKDRTAQINSDAVFAALRRLNKEVTLVRYPNEEHSLMTYSDEENLFERMINWFQTHLQPGQPSHRLGN